MGGGFDKVGPRTYSSNKIRCISEWFESSDVAEHVQFQTQFIFVGLDMVACSGWAAF